MSNYDDRRREKTTQLCAAGRRFWAAALAMHSKRPQIGTSSLAEAMVRSS